MKNAGAILGVIIVLVIAWLIVWGIAAAVLWACNTLFDFGWPYDWRHVLSVIIVFMVWASAHSVKIKLE